MLSAAEDCWTPLPPCELIPSYFSMVRLEGSWFYWTVDGDQYAYASKKSSRVLREKETIYDVDFEAAPGYKVGLSLQTYAMPGEVHLNWTHQDCRASNHHTIRGEEGKFFLVTLATHWQVPQVVDAGKEAYVRGRLKWRYEVFEGNYSVPFHCYSCELEPYIGIRVLDTHQNMKAKGLFNTSSLIVLEKERIKCEDKAIGPVIGLSLRMPLCDSFSLFGKGAGAILWGNVENKLKCTTALIDNTVYKSRSRENVRLERPMLDLEIGVEWLLPLSEKMKPLLRLSWESHTLFNAFRYFVDTDPAIDPMVFPALRKTKGFATTSGITLAGQLNF